MVHANLLVSFEPAHQGSAKSEVEKLLKEVNKEAKFLDTEVDGLFEIQLEDAKKTVSELKSLCKRESGMFRYTFHWTPIDTWCKSTIKEMQEAIKHIEKGIKDNETWKMDLGKRHYHKEHAYDLIMKLTDGVDKPKVDLENPDKIIKVEIIGSHAGISLLTPDELLIVQNEKK